EKRIGRREIADRVESRVDCARRDRVEARRRRQARDFDVLEAVVLETRLPYFRPAALHDVSVRLETALVPRFDDGLIDGAVGREALAVAQGERRSGCSR